MTITVNGKVVCLKEGTTFEYVIENRYFSGADTYTMSIEFPIKGCPQNISVFGHTRMDSDGRYEAMDCEIQDRGFVQRGVLTVVSRDEVSVRCQFLAGRSVQNFKSGLDDIYITDLDLGTVLVTKTTPSEDCKSIDDGKDLVVFPWVNNTSGNLQDEMLWDTDNHCWKWTTQGATTAHPYLIYVAKKICEAIGYTYTFDLWENDVRRFLVVCNTVPYAWSDFQLSIILPRWTVQQFFDELESFLEFDFDIDQINKTVKVSDRATNISSLSVVPLDMVLDEFSSDVSDEDSTNYIGTRNLRYADAGHGMSKFYNCKWFLDSYQQLVVDYPSLVSLINNNIDLQFIGSFSYKNGNRILHDEANDDYYILVSDSIYDTGTQDPRGRELYYLQTRLVKINEFGDSVYAADSVNDKELKIVPAWLDNKDGYYVLFLECGDYESSSANWVTRGLDWRKYSTQQNDPFASSEQHPIVTNSRVYQSLDLGEDDGKEYFSQIFVGFWDGQYNIHLMPHPKVSNYLITPGWTAFHDGFSLKLKGGTICRSFAPDIHYSEKYNFSFLSKSIPDVRSTFLISGKKYLCEKITATFDERGKSELLKGVFYRIS